MALDFPTNPALNEIYTYGGRSWQWNGTAWDVYSTISGNVVTKLNGLTGGVTLAAGTNITLTPAGNTITIASSGGSGGSGVTGATGATGATGSQGIQGNTGATGPVGDYVISFNGLTGSIGITNGSGITLSVSGQTLTISHLVTNENTDATRYIGFYGSTSGTDTPRTDIGLRYNPFTQTISGMGGLVLSGISFGGAVSNNSISLYDPNIGSVVISSSDGNVNFTTPLQAIGDVASISLLSQDTLENGFIARIVPQTYYSASRIFTLPDDSGTVALTKNVVSSFNGLTGAVTGISSFNGRTGSVQGVSAAAAGTGISVSGATGSVTITNTGVLSFNGLTGAVTGVTTGTANTFGPVQTFSGGINATGATLTSPVYISGLGTPTTDTQAANKAYVDSVASVGIHYHDAVVLASTDAETFNTGVTYNNGTSGVGATLRKTASFARINIDSTNGSTGDRILIRSAATQQWNGVYSVTNQGDGTTGWILTRTSDADNYHPYENDGLGANDYFFVTSGSSLKNNAYICNNVGGITFGTTAITFAVFSTPPVYTAGTGLALNSLQFSNTGVLSFNGSTGSVQGVSAAVAGTGISVSGATGSVTITNTGVLSINGGTGAITNVAKTNVDNNFSVNQTISAGDDSRLVVTDSTNSTEIHLVTGGAPSIYSTDFNGESSLIFTYDGSNSISVNIPNYSTTLAGLAGTQTFTGTNTFTALSNFNAGISAAGGVTLAGTLQGTTANFTGLVSSTVGFSGSGTNLTGNASGLTAGSASKVQISEAAGTTYYLALATGTGNTGIYIDTSVPRWTYIPSTGVLSTPAGSLSAYEITAVATIISNNYYPYDNNSPTYFTSSFNGTVSLPIYIGDVDVNGHNTVFVINDDLSTFSFQNDGLFAGSVNINLSGGLGLYNSGPLKFYDIQEPQGYVGFQAPNIANNVTWTLPSSDGSSNQVLTTNGSGILSWTKPVTTFNGLSGGVTLAAGSNITLTPVGNTITIASSGSAGSSVTSFNGLTGAVQGVSSVNGLTGAVTAVTSVEGMTGDVSISAVDLYLISIGII